MADVEVPHAVILVYHHVAEDTPAITSVTPAVFARQLAYLEREGFVVWPVSRILEVLSNGDPIPEHTVGFSFDDAYLSVFTQAGPMLSRRGWPYTVFVSTDYVDQRLTNYMSWDQLRRLAADGAEVANHSRAHAHGFDRLAGESESDWLVRFRRDATSAQARIDRELGTGQPRVYAYPYGEYDDRLEAVIDDLGWFGVGQQSGVVGVDGPFTSAPRFPIATGYDDPDAFALRVHAEPLPVRVLTPASRLVDDAPIPPTFRLALRSGRFPASSIGCFDGRGRALEMSWSDSVLTMRAEERLGVGRSKYTCTAPLPGRRGVFGWFSYLWIVRP